MTLAVNLSSAERFPGIETTFTENVSSGGAKVVSSRPWRAGERISFVLLPGGFQVKARVVYCHPRGNREFIIGLEFLESVARWFLCAPDTRDNLHG
jgi:hypothetical protein